MKIHWVVYAYLLLAVFCVLCFLLYMWNFDQVYLYSFDSQKGMSWSQVVVGGVGLSFTIAVCSAAWNVFTGRWVPPWVEVVAVSRTRRQSQYQKAEKHLRRVTVTTEQRLHEHEARQLEIRLNLLRQEARLLGVEDEVYGFLSQSKPDETAAREHIKLARALREHQEFLQRLEQRVVGIPAKFRERYSLPVLLAEVISTQPGRRPYRKALYALESALIEAEQLLSR